LSVLQKTIETEAVLRGIGIHTGKECSLRLLPAAANQGVVFIRVDLPNRPSVEAVLGNLVETDRRTALASNGVRVETVEHFLAALFVAGIDNCLVEIDTTELPALDGSGLPYYNLVSGSGARDLDAPRREITVSRPFEVTSESGSMRALPSEALSISYRLDYPDLKLEQSVEFRVSPQAYARDIAPARTFCLEEEIESLRTAGFGKGATEENTVVLAAGGAKGELRFADEPARHKVLDLLGDLFFVGGMLTGRIECERSGHALNRELVRALLGHEQMSRRGGE
jgi:UDP-3-O-acyl N-acetylglucosamine deacetylase